MKETLQAAKATTTSEGDACTAGEDDGNTVGVSSATPAWQTINERHVLSRTDGVNAENPNSPVDDTNNNTADHGSSPSAKQNQQLGVAVVPELLNYKDSLQGSRLPASHQHHRRRLHDRQRNVPIHEEEGPDPSMLGPDGKVAAMEQPTVPVIVQQASVEVPSSFSIPFADASPIFPPHEEQLRDRIAALEATQEAQAHRSELEHRKEDATENTRSKTRRRRRRRWLIGVVVALVVLGLVAAIVGLTWSNQAASTITSGSGGTRTASSAGSISTNTTTVEDRVEWIRQATLLRTTASSVPILQYISLRNITDSSDVSVEELAMALVVEQADDTITKERLIQRYALTVLLQMKQQRPEETPTQTNATYKATTIAVDWPWWNFQDDECQWPGVSCGPQTDFVVDLELSHTPVSPHPPLRGTLPPDVGLLTTLLSIQVENNTLTGTIPPTLGRLTHLMKLHLFDNDFTGTFPASAFGPHLSDLLVLRVGGNRLKGTVPTIQAPSLQWISFYQNELTGSLPDDIFADGPSTSLQALVLSHNQLTGTIPQMFWSGELRALGHLVLSDNQLTGTLPDRGPASLERLELRGNQFTGTIPEWTQGIPYLDVSDNSFRDVAANETLWNSSAIAWNSTVVPSSVSAEEEDED